MSLLHPLLWGTYCQKLHVKLIVHQSAVFNRLFMTPRDSAVVSERFYGHHDVLLASGIDQIDHLDTSCIMHINHGVISQHVPPQVSRG